jgi:ADP-heptose:LPS heptosyltransferase
MNRNRSMCYSSTPGSRGARRPEGQPFHLLEAHNIYRIVVRTLNYVSLSFLLLVSLLMSLFRARKGRNCTLHEAKHILIIRYDRLGDFIVSLPAFRSIKSQFPNVRITVVLNESIRSVAEANRFYDNSFFVDYTRLLSSPSYLMKLIRKLRARQYDICYDAMALRSMRSAVIAALSRSPRLVGRDLGILRRHIFTNPVSADVTSQGGGSRYEGDLVWKLFSSTGLKKGLGTTTLRIPPEVEDSIGVLFKQHRLKPEDTIVGIAPSIGGVDRKREWPIEKYCGLISKLFQKYSCKIILLSGAEGSSICNQIANGLDFSIINLAGRTDLLELCGVIRRLSILITAFTGTTHIGVALGKEVITICGGTNPDRWAGGIPNNHIIRLDLPCSPCEYRLRIEQCDHQMREFACMGDLDVGLVYSKACEIIDSFPNRHLGGLSNCSQQRNQASIG